MAPLLTPSTPISLLTPQYTSHSTSTRSVANIRAHLAAAVPPQDQILLLGPPFKVPKDSTIRSDQVLNALRLGDMEDDFIPEEHAAAASILSANDRSGAKRLYLFSKSALSEHAPDPPPCRLEPRNILTLPTKPPEPSPLLLDPASPPLHQALLAYERQFMLYLSQARVLADGADLRLAACRTTVHELVVMCRSLRAANSNLSDHYHGAARTRAEFTATFQAKTAAHAALLHKFEAILSSQLPMIPLHPALRLAARTAARNMETLQDTVPVDRERTWAAQCLSSHVRLVQLFDELNEAYQSLGTVTARQEEAARDLAAEENVQELFQLVEGTARSVRQKQAARLDRLTECHCQVVKVIMNAISAGNDDNVQNAFTPLREMSNSSKDIIPAMLQDDAALLAIMEQVAEAKTNAMKRMRVRLRSVSSAQSSIQRVLSSVGILRDALTQQTENMVHLEHVEQLPDSYRSFLSELRRRRAYGHAVTATSAAMMERLAAMREMEVKSREKFLRGPGRHLMPAFFDIFVPTLATPPPLFTPQLPAMVELDTLPDVGPDPAHQANIATTATTTATKAVMMNAAAATAEQQGVSSASTLTAESQPTPQQSVDHEPILQMMAATGPTGVAARQQQQEQLIVSADEHSGDDELMLDPASGADAKAKTLAYENAVLRQALERLGGKAPRVNVEEEATVVAVNELESLRNELQKAKADAQSARAALEQEKRSAVSMVSRSGSDKISHSSFDVGDVGLFMPTGRGTGGKRMYLAFHTNCPHRYLSTDCIKGSPDFVLGRIVYQEELVAGDVGTDANPYGLHVGTTFWVLTVEVLKSQS
jgi:hypothetical protein